MREATPPPRTLTIVLLLVLTASLLPACSGEPGGQRVPLGAEAGHVPSLEPALQAELDAGNAAYRERRFEVALAHYSAAVRLDADLAAGWYGVALAQGALGDSAARGLALAEVERLAPEIIVHHP
jgi:tetratricopeptide (TPR) repeat protein